MADRFIDKDETQIYGPHAVRMILAKVIGLVPACDAGLRYVMQQLDEQTQAVARAVAGARGADAELRKGARQRNPALKKGLNTLTRFSNHLDSHESDIIDRKVYFPIDGTVRSIGRSGGKVHLALTHIAGKLGDPNSGVKDAASWLTEVQSAAAPLSTIVGQTALTRADRQDMTPEVAAARASWLQVYLAAKSMVEGVLRLTGKLQLMPRIFHDLAVPASAKVTTPPPADEPPAPAEEALIPGKD